jgi:hypothetical protein
MEPWTVMLGIVLVGILALALLTAAAMISVVTSRL